MTREALLVEIISEILVSNINYKDDPQDCLRFEIVRKNGVTTYCNYDSPNNLRKMQTLFFICFNIGNKKFHIDIDTKSPELSKLTQNRVITNAISYFEQKGIRFDIFEKYCIDIAEYHNLLLTAIVDFILPAIFHKDFTKKCEKYDDITKVYENAICAVRDMLTRFRMYRVTQTTGNEEIIKIKDSRYHENECNYAILYDNEIVPHAYLAPIDISFPLHTIAISEEYKQSCIAVQNESPFDRLVNGFYPYPFKETPTDLYFRDIKTEDESPSAIRFPLSAVKLHFPEFDDHYYYLTHLDPETVERDYKNITTHQELTEALRIRSLEDVKKIYEARLLRYYVSVTEYMTDILKKLADAPLFEIAGIEAATNENYKKALRLFQIDPQTVAETIENEETSLTDYIYHHLQYAIYNLAASLFKSAGLAAEIRNYLKQYTKDIELNEHIQAVKRFLNNETFKRLVEYQKSHPITSELPEQSAIMEADFERQQEYAKAIELHEFADLYITQSIWT